MANNLTLELKKMGIKKLLLTSAFLLIFTLAGFTQARVEIIATQQSDGSAIDKFYWTENKWINVDGGEVIYKINSPTTSHDSSSIYFVGQKTHSEQLEFNSYFFEIELRDGLINNDSLNFVISGTASNSGGLQLFVLNTGQKVSKRILRDEGKISEVSKPIFIDLLSDAWESVSMPLQNYNSCVKLIFVLQNEYDRFYISFDNKIQTEIFSTKFKYTPSTFELATSNLDLTFGSDTVLSGLVQQTIDILNLHQNSNSKIYLLPDDDFDRLYIGVMSVKQYKRTELIKSIFEDQLNANFDIEIVDSSFESYDLNSIRIKLISTKEKIWKNY